MNNSRIQALHEILGNKIWWMTPEALHSSRDLITSNMESRAYVQDNDVCCSTMAEVAYNDEYTLEEKVANVHILYIDGPIIRNGGACSYGSINYKEQTIAAAKEGVLGHIFVINSPGGSALSLFDFRDAINYAHSLNQPVIAFVKGMAASAAYACAMMCDHIVCYSDHDQVGCIGAMAAFYTQKDGDVNYITQETYHEIYSSFSPLKNDESRKAADGDMSGISTLVDKSAQEFLSLVNEYRPSVTDEQKLGLTYDAKDVIPSLVDEIGDMERCVALVVEKSADMLRADRKANTTFTER